MVEGRGTVRVRVQVRLVICGVSLYSGLTLRALSRLRLRLLSELELEIWLITFKLKPVSIEALLTSQSHQEVENRHRRGLGWGWLIKVGV